MQFNKLNNLFGWLVCAVACTVYLVTLEPTTSFWDCGEFISSANKLQIPHPPGSPLFILMGRFFVILFGDNPQTAAIAVNSMSWLPWPSLRPINGKDLSVLLLLKQPQTMDWVIM